MKLMIMNHGVLEILSLLLVSPHRLVQYLNNQVTVLFSILNAITKVNLNLLVIVFLICKNKDGLFQLDQSIFLMENPSKHSRMLTTRVNPRLLPSLNFV